jgi:hypothetical protein
MKSSRLGRGKSVSPSPEVIQSVERSALQIISLLAVLVSHEEKTNTKKSGINSDGTRKNILLLYASR